MLQQLVSERTSQRTSQLALATISYLPRSPRRCRAAWGLCGNPGIRPGTREGVA
jgi:hypothetical protein